MRKPLSLRCVFSWLPATTIPKPTSHIVRWPAWAVFHKYTQWNQKILTHHSGACISCQIEPQEPSTSLANDPMGRILHFRPNNETREVMSEEESLLKHGLWKSVLSYLHWWSSCNNQCGGYLAPIRSLLFSSHCPLSPEHCEQPGPCVCTARDRQGTQVSVDKALWPICSTHL